MLCQWRCRSASLRWLCSTATRANRRRNRRIVCGVRLISGTSTIASRPRATTCSIAADRPRSCRCRSRRGSGTGRTPPPRSPARSRQGAACSGVRIRASARPGRPGLGGGVRSPDRWRPSRRHPARQPTRQPSPDRVHQARFRRRLNRPGVHFGQPADVGDRERLVGPGRTASTLGCLAVERCARGPRRQLAPGFLGHDQERPDPRPGVLLHARRDHGVERLAPRARVIVRQPPRQLEHLGVDQGDGSRTSDDVLDLRRAISALGGPRLIDSHAIADASLSPGPAARAPAAPAGSSAQPVRHAVGQDLLDRPVEDDARETDRRPASSFSECRTRPPGEGLALPSAEGFGSDCGPTGLAFSRRDACGAAALPLTTLMIGPIVGFGSRLGAWPASEAPCPVGRPDRHVWPSSAADSSAISHLVHTESRFDWVFRAGKWAVVVDETGTFRRHV